MLFFNANFICYYFYPTKKREEPTYETFVLLPLMSFSIYCTFKNHKTSLRLRNYISSVSYTNLLGICAIAIIVNWYYEPPSTIEV